MESLIALADRTELRHVRLAGGTDVAIRTLCIEFSRATPGFLKRGVLPETYTSKPLVSVRGDAMFGELAIVRWLEQDGWDAAWVDTAHGRKFWRAMPHKSAPVALPPEIRARYDAIVALNGGRASGFFDVLAWRGGQLVFVDYRSDDDPPTRNTARWIAAALCTGVSEHDLWIVLRPSADLSSVYQIPR